MRWVQKFRVQKAVKKKLLKNYTNDKLQFYEQIRTSVYLKYDMVAW